MIDQMRIWLDFHPNDVNVRTKHMGLVGTRGSLNQQQDAIVQTKTWLDNYHNNDSVRAKFLELVYRSGTKEERREAITKAQVWLQENPKGSNSWNIRVRILTLGIKQATIEKRNLIVQANSWLNNHSDNRYVRTPYLILINNGGSIEQKREALSQTRSWLDKHPDDFSTYSQYVNLIIKVGSERIHRNTINNLSELVGNAQSLENSHLLSHYLKLVKIVGLDEERKYALNQMSNWLDFYFDSYVLAGYLELLQENSNDSQEVRRRIGQWWEWIIQQEKVEARIWLRFLTVLWQKSPRDLWKKPVNLALIQHPNNIHISIFILRHFREVLDNETKCLIQSTINQTK